MAELVTRLFTAFSPPPGGAGASGGQPEGGFRSGAVLGAAGAGQAAGVPGRSS